MPAACAGAASSSSRGRDCSLPVSRNSAGSGDGCCDWLAALLAVGFRAWSQRVRRGDWERSVLTRETLPSTGLLGMDLVRLGLERSKNAREATEVVGALISAMGRVGPGNMTSISAIAADSLSPIMPMLTCSRLGASMDCATGRGSGVHLESIYDRCWQSRIGGRGELCARSRMGR